MHVRTRLAIGINQNCDVIVIRCQKKNGNGAQDWYTGNGNGTQDWYTENGNGTQDRYTENGNGT